MRYVSEILKHAPFIALVPFASVSLSAYGAQPPIAQDLTLERIDAINEANRKAIVTVDFSERVSETTAETPGGDERAAERMMRAYLSSQRRSVESALARGATPRTVERILEAGASRIGSVDDAVVMRRLNRNTLVERTGVVDFSRRRARYDDRDLRSLETLAKRHGLSEDDRRYNLSRTRAYILEADRSIELHPAGTLAVVRGGGGFDADRLAARFGSVPEWVFADDLELELRVGRGDAEQLVEIVGRQRSDGAVTVRVELRPDWGYRMARFVRYDGQGAPVEQLSLSDYREVDGLMVPFSVRMQRAANGIADYLVRERKAETVRVNLPVEADRFEIPSDYNVQDIRLAGGKRHAASPAGP